MLLVPTRGTPFTPYFYPPLSSLHSLYPIYYGVEGVLLVLTRGSPLHSLLLPASTLPFAPSTLLLWSRGSASLPLFRGGIGSGQQVGILGITPLVTHIGYPPPTPLMGATLGGCR